MTDSLKIDGVSFIPAQSAGKLVGYTGDYVSRLAREGKIKASKVGRQWLVDPDSLKTFSKLSEMQKSERNQQLRTVRKREQRADKISEKKQVLENELQQKINQGAPVAVFATTCIVLLGVCIGSAGYYGLTGAYSKTAVISALEQTAAGVYSLTLTAEDNAQTALSTTAGEVAGETINRRELVEDQKDKFEYGGVVVFDNATTDETLAAVRNSFSDEVIVEVDENNPDTGLVTPVFKAREGAAYRYLLVPVQEE